MKNQKTTNVLSIGFYRRDQWPLLLDAADDKQVIEDTYDGWVSSLEKALAMMRSSGVEPLKVDVDVNELLAWLKKQGLKNTGVARAEFIAELSRQGRGKKIDATECLGFCLNNASRKKPKHFHHRSASS